MKPSSAKAKGRTLQQWVQKKILELNPSLTENDVRSTPMGTQGEDVQLSEAARSLVPFHIEAKNRAKIAIYSFYEQPKTKDAVLLVIKANHKKPLAVLDADLFFKLIRDLHDPKKD